MVLHENKYAQLLELYVESDLLLIKVSKENNSNGKNSQIKMEE